MRSRAEIRLTQRRPIVVERRPLQGRHPRRTPAEVHALGVEAVRVALRPLADDVARTTCGRWRWPAAMIATEAGGL